MDELCLHDLQHQLDLQDARIKKQEALMDTMDKRIDNMYKAMDYITDKVNGLIKYIDGQPELFEKLYKLKRVDGLTDKINGLMDNQSRLLALVDSLIDKVKDLKDKVKDLEDDDKYVPSSSEEENEEDFEGLVSEEDVSVESQPDKRGFKQFKERSAPGSSAPGAKLPRTFMQKISAAVTKNQKTKGR